LRTVRAVIIWYRYHLTKHKKTVKNEDPHKFDPNANNWETES
jgi:hypothetical protein